MSSFHQDHRSDTEDEEQHLSWRLDPEESLSDWTIVIEGQTYHVHKNILAVGPCKSEYFASLFRSGFLKEAETQTSHIQLEEMAAVAMPLMLDFMYSRGEAKITSPSEAVSLKHLAQYFGIRLLQKRVLNYIQNDMTMSNLDDYLQTAKLFQDDTVLQMAMQLLVTKVQDICPMTHKAVLQAMDIDLFLSFLTEVDHPCSSISNHLSRLVASYGQLHHADLDLIQYQQLTDRRWIPLVDAAAALDLLKLEADLVTAASGDEVLTATLTCLQKRCIQVLAQHWKDMPSIMDTKLPAHVLQHLLERVIVMARNHVENYKVTVEQKAEQQGEIDQLNESAAETLKQLSQERQERQRLQQELAEIKRHLTIKDREVAEYQREWSRLVRVPVHHTFSRDIKKCTYHHLSEKEPFDSGHYLGQYGKSRPTAMPSIGDAAEDGYLFVQKSGQFTERWPMFYYTDR